MKALEHALGRLMVARHGSTTGADLGPICTDSRQVRQGSVFVALKGERFDGHNYAAQAARDGASVVIVERDTGASCPQIIVSDTQEALGALARAWRSQFTAPVICVAGSNGKTTTTQMIASILRTYVGEDCVVATEKNYNNHIGVPQTLLRFTNGPKVTKVAVIEAGISHPGEMARLVSWIRPTVTVITNAQREHQEFLDGVEASARENAFAIVALSAKGTVVLPQKDPCLPIWLDYARARGCKVSLYCRGECNAADVSVQRKGDKFEIRCGGKAIETTLSIAGAHAEHDAAAAAAATLAVGVTPEAVAKGLARFEALAGRGKRYQLAGGALLIDESYNANPDSMRAAIDLLAAQPAPRILVAGEMGEIGEKRVEFHAEIGRYAKQKGIDRLLATGPDMVYAVQAFGAAGRHYEATDMLLRAVREAVRAPASVLVKASHSQHLDQLVESLLKDPGQVGRTAVPAAASSEKKDQEDN